MNKLNHRYEVFCIKWQLEIECSPVFNEDEMIKESDEGKKASIYANTTEQKLEMRHEEKLF